MEDHQLIVETSYLLTNSNPYLDYPRPMLQKTVPVGGITVPSDLRKHKLPKKWDGILDKRNHTVLVSFGSAAKAMYMPSRYKYAIQIGKSKFETNQIRIL
ncbi:unnamed protein product [Strongylus vulgaris]|uniref:glucuronosyltransferase n=1 Tax=Strongylus vulgaris TaxID=40348 RepID=A0A3P7JRJ7_STRVU|nr:unnamed protein product [Strongylus vulgaris]